METERSKFDLSLFLYIAKKINMKYNNFMKTTNQRLIPFLTFHGNAEEAMNFYEKNLPNAKIENIVYFEKGQRGDEGKVMNGTLSFMGQTIMFLDMNAEYDCPFFNWASSLYVDCSSVEEFDAVFNGLAQGGTVMMKEEPFMHFRKVAWVTDKFGVTWQPVLE
jgi:predicted 3-demethylubiquinone-9 3-methyltransferase (glyoxalase superfamily)